MHLKKRFCKQQAKILSNSCLAQLSNQRNGQMFAIKTNTMPYTGLQVSKTCCINSNKHRCTPRSLSMKQNIHKSDCQQKLLKIYQINFTDHRSKYKNYSESVKQEYQTQSKFMIKHKSFKKSLLKKNKNTLKKQSNRILTPSAYSWHKKQEQGQNLSYTVKRGNYTLLQMQSSLQGRNMIKKLNNTNVSLQVSRLINTPSIHWSNSLGGQIKDTKSVDNLGIKLFCLPTNQKLPKKRAIKTEFKQQSFSMGSFLKICRCNEA